MRLSKSRLVVSLLFIFMLAPLWSASAQEDTGGDSGVVSADTVQEIGNLTVPNVFLNFDDLPQGPTSLNSIFNAFPGSCLNGLEFTTRAGTGTYNFQTDGGSALAANPDGLGGLYIVDPPAGIYGNADFLTVNFAVDITQFGFEIGDWAGDFQAELFNGPVSVGLLVVNTAGNNRTHNFMSDVPFDRVVLSVTPPDIGVANWVVPSMRIPTCGSAAVPTLSEWGLAAMAAVLGAIGLYAAFRRRKVQA